MWAKGKTSVAGAAVVAACLSAPALPTAAQGAPEVFQVPPGCTAFLTVQSRGCMVSHHWTCEGDAPGTHWRAALDSDGPFSLSFTDAEFRWLQSWDLRRGSITSLIEPEEDPANLTELLATGNDAMVFSLRIEGPSGSSQRDYTGFDRLTGDAVTVDGRSLLMTEFTYQFDTGIGARRVSGNQFVHEGWRMFFGGIETVTEGDGTSFEYDSSPMEFAEPGEAGFLSLEPIYDCGEMMSGAPQVPLQNG
jgi:hypothetical protein